MYSCVFHISCIYTWRLFRSRGRRGGDRMVVRFTINCVICAYHHLSFEFESRSWWGVLYTTLWDQVCQWHTAGGWFSPVTPVFPINKTYLHNITEILLKVALSTITLLTLFRYGCTLVKNKNVNIINFVILKYPRVPSLRHLTLYICR